MTDTTIFRAAEFSHVGYLTDRFDEAVDALWQRCGIKSFMDLGVFSFPNAAGEAVHTRTGMAFVGSSFVELIQPLSGAVDIYREALDGSKSVMLWHHLAFAVPTQQQLDAMRAVAEQDGQSIVLTNPVGDFFYADTRVLTGHYSEYFVMHAERMAMHDAIRAMAGSASVPA